RTALTHFLSTSEAKIDLDDAIDANEYRISGQVFVMFKKDENENAVFKSIYKCEMKYSDSITHFQQIATNKGFNVCTYVFFGNIFDFRSFVDELDSMSTISQVRYVINE
ncbi:MAG: hypothetical protein ACTSXU_12480, partial [Promethearchaeota archaeon]